MRRMPKMYGEYKTDSCPFCGKSAIVRNKLGIAVCSAHKDSESPTLKCLCGDYVDIQKGKFGNYGTCMRCGNINLQKILKYNGIID